MGEVKVKVTQSCPTLWIHGLYSPWNSPGQNTRVGNLSLLQEIFPTQGSNPGLLHCRQILYQMSYKGTPKILEWVAYPFSTGSSRLRNWTGVSSIAGGFFANWAIMGLNKCLITCFNQYGIVQSIFTVLKICTVLPANSPHPPQLLATTDFFLLSSCCCSVTQSWDPRDYTAGLPVLHHLPELAQTYVQWVSVAIQPSHPLSSPSPPAFNLSQHQDLFQWVDCLHKVAKVLEL